VAEQPDNKVVVAGYSLSGSPGFALIGFNENGSVDQAFGLSGLVITDFDGGIETPRDLASRRRLSRILLPLCYTVAYTDNIHIDRIESIELRFRYGHG
jgi:Domain of unknown function (DUF5122) beta-propeller